MEKPLFEGADGAIDSFLALIETVQEIDARLTALGGNVVQILELSAEGWQEARIQALEDSRSKHQNVGRQ